MERVADNTFELLLQEAVPVVIPDILECTYGCAGGE